MNDAQSDLGQVNLISLKTVIRTKNLEASKKFYTEILQLTVVQNYNDSDGSKGCILRIGDVDSQAFIELSEIKNNHEYYQNAFGEDFKNDKTDLQISTKDIAYWANRINKLWTARGPVLRPWGSSYLYLRDPDGLQIIIYQE